MTVFTDDVCDILYEHDEYIRNGLNPLYLELHYILNYVLNVITCLGIWLYTKNVVILLVGFVVFDFIMTTINHYLFYVIWPKKFSSMTLEERKKYITNIKTKYLCEFEELSDASRYHTRSVYSDYMRWLESEEKRIASEEEAIKESLIKADTKTSKDYSDKIEYFNNLIVKLDYYIKLYKLNSLKSIKKSVVSLLDTLNKKPIGFTIISYSVYIYLDEIQTVLLQFESLDKEVRMSYYDRFSEVADLLSKSLEDLNTKILRMETKPIDLTLDVLLKELSVINETMEVEVEKKEEEDGCIKVD